MRRSSLLAVLLTVTLTGVACGGGGGGGGGGGQDALPRCPLDALRSAPKPVEITFWHAMTRANEEALVALTKRFNESQGDVRVKLVNQTSYADNLTRFKAGLGTGNLPDLVQIEDVALQLMIDSRAVLPAEACAKADGYDFSDHIERVLRYYTVEGTLWPMPFNVSNPVLYYDRALFRKAGLDPDRPPRTLEEVRAVSERIVTSGAAPFGIALKNDSWFIEHWLAKAGHTLVDNGNGRRGRATRVTFDDATGIGLFRWIDGMARAKLLLNTGDSDLDHYLAVANGRAAMTIDTSAALGTISQVLGSGQFAHVELGVGPMPGPDSPQGGVLVGGAALYISARSSPARQAAAWRFATFLNQPDTQAEWAAATGYIPIRKSAVGMAPLAQRWAQAPGYRVAYDQLLAGPENDATAGPVLGAYGGAGQGVRGAIIDALAAMLTRGVPPEQAVREAARKADAAIAEYNARVG
jgi:sn-glycerol 3-phosphate transport system substrate-binding protein